MRKIFPIFYSSDRYAHENVQMETGMDEEEILICEDSPEGIFTGIYTAYEWKCDPAHTCIQVGEEENLRLFARYREVAADPEKAEKVSRTIRRRFGGECHEKIWYALSSWEQDRGQAVYQTVAVGLTGRVKGMLLDHLSNRYVRRTFELWRNVWYESHHLLGFVRFQETAEGILFSQIGPKNQVLPLLMPHFADRFPGENFVIYDEGRKLYGIHPAGQEWFLAHLERGPSGEELEFSEEEYRIQELFRFFCRRITIEERRNEKLQRQMLPLRFQKYMVEFVENEQRK